MKKNYEVGVSVMNAHLFQDIIEKLLKLHNSKKYLTYDNIMDICDACSVPLTHIEAVLTEVTDRGCKIFEHIPTKQELNAANKTESSFESKDYAQTDYEKLYDEVLKTDPELKTIIQYARQIRPAQHGEATYIFENQNIVPEGRKRLFDMNFRSVIKIAFQKYPLCDEELADLIQFGSIGLLISIDKYDVSSESPFASYANSWIFQAISRGITYRKNGCYFPAYISDTLREIERMADMHVCSKCSGTKLYCPNLIAEIRKRYELDCDSAKTLLSYTQGVLSYEEIVEDESYIAQLSDLEMFCQRMDDTIFDEQRSNEVSEALNSLKPKERDIVYRRYGFDGMKCLTLDECGTIYGVTKERIRQIENCALRNLKARDSRFKLSHFSQEV